MTLPHPCMKIGVKLGQLRSYYFVMTVITILRMTYVPIGSIYHNNSSMVLTCLMFVPVVRYCLGKGEVFLLLINRLLDHLLIQLLHAYLKSS